MSNLPNDKKPERCFICDKLTRNWRLYEVPGTDHELLLCPTCIRDEEEHKAEYRDYLVWLDSQQVK